MLNWTEKHKNMHWQQYIGEYHYSEEYEIVLKIKVSNLISFKSFFFFFNDSASEMNDH